MRPLGMLYGDYFARNAKAKRKEACCQTIFGFQLRMASEPHPSLLVPIRQSNGNCQDMLTGLLVGVAWAAVTVTCAHLEGRGTK